MNGQYVINDTTVSIPMHWLRSANRDLKMYDDAKKELSLYKAQNLSLKNYSSSLYEEKVILQEKLNFSDVVLKSKDNVIQSLNNDYNALNVLYQKDMRKQKRKLAFSKPLYGVIGIAAGIIIGMIVIK